MRRPPVSPALRLVAVLLASAVPFALAACGAEEDPRAAACSALRGDLQLAPDGTAACAVPRTAYAVEVVRLDADGTIDAADAARRRAACDADGRTAVRRARASASRRSVGEYATVRWTAPGVCRAVRGRLPAGEARELRALRLRADARAALRTGATATALELARRADALAPSAASRSLVARARAAADVPPSAPSTSVVSPNEYLGLPCSQIGHAFRVAPGSDPAHDPDGDGEACEGR